MPLRDDLLAPIPGAKPSGENLRYAPVYDKIKEARREDDDAPQGDWQRERKVADFNLVIKLASDALATKSKDLQLAAWLTEASLKKDGFSGLHECLELLRALLAEYWETLYPEIEDGDLELRAAPLDWVGTYLGDSIRKTGITKSGLGFYKYKESRSVGYEEQASESDAKRAAREAAIAEGKITAEDFDAAVQNTATTLYAAWVGSLDGSLERLEALNELCDEKFGEYTPGFSKLRTALEEVRQVVNSLWQQKLDKEGRPAPAAEEIAEAPANDERQFAAVSSSGAAAAPARTAPRRAVAGLEPADTDEAALRLAAIAKYLRQADGYSPAPYLMLRGFRWGELRGYGENPDSSLLAAPSTETRQQIKRLALDANWAELIETAETAMAEPCGRAWLDLQRYVVKACEEYGYPAIAIAIKAELRTLLHDFPKLTEWTLADDTPTANGETQAWLREFLQPQWIASTPVTATESEDAATPDGYDLAMEKVRSGRPGEAIEMLAQDIQMQTSGRGRFQRKLQLAQLCMAAGHETLAHPILEHLVEEIDKHQLEHWEAADMVAHALSLLYRSSEKLNGDPAVKQKIYARICRLDPMQALAL
ncbi:MAG: type VI secretion system protein TssA [Acidobacteriota bacterium]|nr:type VI secretion system protein TssA [Acidobacteriota bacterium]